MTNENNPPSAPVAGLALPLRFDAGTYSGNIVDAGKVVIAYNVHANIGPLLVAAANRAPVYDELLALLDLLYSKWEDGTDCYEDPEDYTGPLGKAFKLTTEEEERIIAVLDAFRPRAALSHAEQVKP